MRTYMTNSSSLWSVFGGRLEHYKRFFATYMELILALASLSS